MDIISFNEAATANGRIEKFIENPDSNSGIVTVPKVIGAGENVIIPAGRVAVLPNVQVDGTLNIEGEVFIPSGSAIDMGNGLAINGEKVVMSVPTSYHLLQGNLAVDNTVITQGFNTTLYTGNGTTQSINTGIDMATQWGDNSSETFGGLVWIKSRSAATNNFLFDTIRGALDEINSNATDAQASLANSLTAFNSNGFSLENATGINVSSATYASWNFQTTHRISGVTNHGKPYTCHYNPYTGFTIVKYEGSGIAGHEIPHHLGRKLGLTVVKNLNAAQNWVVSYSDVGFLELNTTKALATTYSCTMLENKTVIANTSNWNDSGNQYIMYGWANSYYDENKLIGNYEVGVYQGTGVAGNKVTTRGKPAWVMVKRLDIADNWQITDNIRNNGRLYPNLTNIEDSNTTLSIAQDGFILSTNSNTNNASGGQYLYMVAYDTNSNGGGSYYPRATDTANVQINNALIPIAKGSDINGLKNVMLSKNETITGLSYTAGKNYIYYDGNGNKGVKSVSPNYGTTNPANGGDFYNVLKNKWYTSAGVEIPEGRNYLNHIVHADNDGGVLYVEELPKIEYKDIIKANEFKGKNACTAWVVFDATTTIPTILDSYNIKSIVRTATGIYDIYFLNNMDNASYSFSLGCYSGIGRHIVNKTGATLSKISISTYNLSGGAFENNQSISIQIFGGKN